MSKYRQTLEKLSETQRIALYRELVARLGPSQTPVSELIVFYERGHQDDIAARMRRIASAELAEHERPTRYLPLSRLPLTAQGKLDRAALNALVPGHESGWTETPPGTPLADKNLASIMTAFAATLRQSDIEPDTNFFERGGHSLLVVECILAIEKSTQVRISAGVFLRHPTPRCLAAELRRETQPTERYLYPIAEAGQGLLVFVFSASRLAYALKREHADWQLYGVQLRWRDESDQLIAYRDLRDLAGRIVAEIRQLAAGRPYILIGSSFAAMIAFEVAVQMKAQGMEPPLTVLIEPSPFSGLRTWLQNDLELTADIKYAQHWLFSKWLLHNNPLRTRFWRRVKNILSNRFSATATSLEVEPSGVALAREKAFERDRIHGLCMGYRASDYRGRLILLATEERAWQLEQNWRRHLPLDTVTHRLDATHINILRDPCMSEAVIPLIEKEVEAVISAA
jgi:thioesterase domain-containing protein/acyl carrier protein